MPRDQRNSERNLELAERRNHARVQVRSLAYIGLDPGNGGLILNINEDGIAVQAAETLVGEYFPQMRFRLPESEEWIDAAGKLVWVGKSKKESGIQFIDLDEDARQQIQNWIDSTVSSADIPVDQVEKPVPAKEAPGAPGSDPGTGKECSEFDSMFPSEKSLSPATFPGLNKPAALDPSIAAAPLKRPKRGASARLDEPTSLDAVIAPGPVKRPKPDVDSRLNSYGIRLVRPGGKPESTAGQGPSRSESRGDLGFGKSNSEEKTAGPPNRDPFASIAFDEPAADSRAFPRSSNAGPASTLPMFEPRPVNFSRLGYQAAARRKSSGRGWIVVAAIVFALLGFGVAMAIGPANLKALLYKYYPATSRATAVSPEPLQPANASGKVPAEERAANPPRALGASPPAPLDSAAEQPILNPAGGKAGSTEARSSGHDAKTETDGEAVFGPDERSNRTSPGELDSSETPESAETKTRRFQREHSQSNGTATSAFRPSAADGGRQPEDLPATAASKPSTPPATPNDRTLDAYARPIPPASAAATAGGPAAAAAAAPQVSVIPTGAVAISSHFYSLRGEEDQTAPSDRPLVIGQLATFRQPVYPVEAARARAEGTVELRASVDPAGRVEIVHLVSGPPILVPAAINAVREWRYGQTILDGRAVGSVEDITVVFRLANSASSPR